MAPDKGRASGFLALLEQGQEIQTTGGCMNIYEAIMKAADHIEQDPSVYKYIYPWVPGVPLLGYKDSVTKGCVIGHIGLCMGLPAGTRVDAPELEGFNKLLGFLELGQPIKDWIAVAAEKRIGESFYPQWRFDAASAAKGMRDYARKYHNPLAKPLKTDAQLVQNLMRKITTERIPEDA